MPGEAAKQFVQTANKLGINAKHLLPRPGQGEVEAPVWIGLEHDKLNQREVRAVSVGLARVLASRSKAFVRVEKEIGLRDRIRLTFHSKKRE